MLEILSRTSNVNFVLDKDIKSDIKTTIFARDTTVEDALNLVLRTSQLNKKVLNESTFLIYADTEEKRKRYEDLVMRTFYLKNADPKKLQEMVRTLIAPQSMFVDDRFKMMIVRDRLPVIAAIERLIATYDIADPEVVLEVEILEVSANGRAQYRRPVSRSPGRERLRQRRHGGPVDGRRAEKSRLEQLPAVPAGPLLVLNLKQTSSDAKTLANPRIRVSNRQRPRS